MKLASSADHADRDRFPRPRIHGHRAVAVIIIAYHDEGSIS